MRALTSNGLILPAVATVLIGLAPASAAAQVGLGPRLTFVRGDFVSATPDSSFLGGTIRTMASAHTSFEFALDYRSQISTDGTQRLREEPFQASLLIYPTRRRLSPYVLGGYGIYTELTDALSPNGLVLATATTRRGGWHLGVGAEFFLTRHASLYLDYRFRFVQFGSSDGSNQPVNLPGVKLTHQGSMWASGMAFYF